MGNRNDLLHIFFLILQMDEIVTEDIDPLKVEVSDPFPVQTGTNPYTMENLEQSSLEEKVDLGNLVLPDSYANEDEEEVNFAIKDEPLENYHISDKADIKKEPVELTVHEYKKAPIGLSANSNHFLSHSYSGQEQNLEYVMSNEEGLLIAQQMRQHIQLLTQMSLLTAKDDHWQELHTDCRGMLSQLVTRSFSQQYSVYAQDNLFPSIQVHNHS